MHLHAEKLIERKGEQRGCLEIRKHLVNYLSGFDGVKEYRKKLTQIESKKEFDILIESIKS